jgi:glycine/D-amino acid oxidase-like deaminating enzyme
MTQHREVIIVGSGPAGYTAALYTARADLAPLVFEGSQYGGALMTTTEVENFPGFPDGITGPELMAHMRAQAARFGADLVSDDVVSLELGGPVKTVRTLSGDYTADAVILAMGSAYRKLGIDREDELSGHGVSSTACPRARPVTASSSATRTSPWSVAVTPRWRRPPSSPASPGPSPWCTAATVCARAGSWPSGPKPTRTSASRGTPRSSTSPAIGR